MLPKIGYGHLAAQNEGDGPSKQPSHNEQTSNGFEHRRNSQKGSKMHTCPVSAHAAECADQFLKAVARKGEPGDQPQYRKGVRLQRADLRCRQPHTGLFYTLIP